MTDQPASVPPPAPGGAGAVPATYTRDAIYLVRTVTQANLSLSQMADQKASILMGATFLVFTICVGQAGKGALSVALVVLALSAFVSAVLAVSAIMPAVKPPVLPEDQRNILFFGVFSQMSEDEFVERTLASLHTDEAVFRTMLRDIWQNGQVLQRKKYRLLGWAYRAFLVGLVLTVAVFVAERIG